MSTRHSSLSQRKQIGSRLECPAQTNRVSPGSLYVMGETRGRGLTSKFIVVVPALGQRKRRCSTFFSTLLPVLGCLDDRWRAAVGTCWGRPRSIGSHLRRWSARCAGASRSPEAAKKGTACYSSVLVDANASAAPAPRANVLTQLERRLRACVQGLRRDHFAGSGGMSDIDLW